MGFIPTAILAAQLIWDQKALDPKSSGTICIVFSNIEGQASGLGPVPALAGEPEQIEEVLRQLRPEEGVQKPSKRDLRQNYRRYDLPG